MNSFNHMMLRLPDVKSITGMSRSTIYLLEKQGRFPKRVALSTRCVAWRLHEIEQWIDERGQKSANEASYEE